MTLPYATAAGGTLMKIKTRAELLLSTHRRRAAVSCVESSDVLIWIKAAHGPLDDDSDMPAALCSSAPAPMRSLWRDVVMPKEHGSWSLAFEPVAFGLILAPSTAGFCIGAAALAGFLSRRPFKLSINERNPDRRNAALTALALLGAVALGALYIAAQTGESGWPVWLLPSAAAGAVFLYFDLRNSGREELAEISGAAAFAGITGVIAAAAGWSTWAIVGAMFLMCARAVPTVIFVRSYIRGTKTGVNRPAAALTAAIVALGGCIVLVSLKIVPAIAIVAAALLFARAAAYLLYPRPRLRPRTIGFQELALGALYISALGVAWHF